MGTTLSDWSAYSILVPFVIGCVKFSKLATTYIPFILFITVGFLAELLSQIIIENGYSNNIVLNVYSLFQSYLIFWQFKNWGLFSRNKNHFPFLLIFFTIFWLIENVQLRFTHAVNSNFLIASSFVIALMSITIINRLIFKEHGSVLKSAAFLICFGWMLYFTYSVLAEAFFLYGLAKKDPHFAARVYAILLYINIFTNFVYATAILWIPTKPKFILPSL